jgi:hypothetical protein
MVHSDRNSGGGAASALTAGSAPRQKSTIVPGQVGLGEVEILVAYVLDDDVPAPGESRKEFGDVGRRGLAVQRPADEEDQELGYQRAAKLRAEGSIVTRRPDGPRPAPRGREAGRGEARRTPPDSRGAAGRARFPSGRERSRRPLPGRRGRDRGRAPSMSSVP